MSRYGAMSFFVDYGDDADPDGDGRPGLTCETTGPTSPFRDSVSSGYSHTYRKADTYTITATGYYCGEGGLQTVEKAATVNMAKPAPAPKVSAAAHIEDTVDGLTATLVPSVTGTQHEMKYGRNKHAKYGVPLVYTMSFPEGAEVSGGATKGGIKRATCTKHGSVEFDPVMLSGDPVVVTFPKPGTYEVTLSADACTSQRIVSKTATIAVPPTHPTLEPTTPTPTEPTPTRRRRSRPPGSDEAGDQHDRPDDDNVDDGGDHARHGPPRPRPTAWVTTPTPCCSASRVSSVRVRSAASSSRAVAFSSDAAVLNR